MFLYLYKLQTGYTILKATCPFPVGGEGEEINNWAYG
jgi:hypothetical protein